MYQVTYTDVNTGEALTLMMKLYQVNNESQLPPEKENRYRTFCTGRIINRTVTEVTDQ